MNGDSVSKHKSSVSRASSYQEIGEYWDTHDVADIWEQTKPVEFDVDLRSEEIYYRIAPELSTQVIRLAEMQGISAETLLNLWVQKIVQHPNLLSNA